MILKILRMNDVIIGDVLRAVTKAYSNLFIFIITGTILISLIYMNRVMGHEYQELLVTLGEGIALNFICISFEGLLLFNGLYVVWVSATPRICRICHCSTRSRAFSRLLLLADNFVAFSSPTFGVVLSLRGFSRLASILHIEVLPEISRLANPYYLAVIFFTWYLAFIPYRWILEPILEKRNSLAYTRILSTRRTQIDVKGVIWGVVLTLLSLTLLLYTFIGMKE